MVTCAQVMAELSNYLDDDVSNVLRKQIEEHIKGCHRCTAVYDSARKVLLIFSDDRVLEVPPGFHERLHNFLSQEISH